MRNQPLHVRVLICVGLLLTTLPLLFKEYVPIPDFARGFLAGVGVGMEATGFVLMKKLNRNCHTGL